MNGWMDVRWSGYGQPTIRIRHVMAGPIPSGPPPVLDAASETEAAAAATWRLFDQG